MKKKKFADGGPTYENNIRDGGTSFIDEFEKSRAKKDEEKPRFETKEGKNPNISDETREKAKKFVESGGKEESKPAPKATLAPKAMPKPAAKAEPKVTPKPTTKAKAEPKVESKAKTSLPMPEYSNEDLDRMGIFVDHANEDLRPAAPVVPVKKKPFIDIPEKSNIGLRQFKNMAKGGSASSRADGCAIRGKTRA